MYGCELVIVPKKRNQNTIEKLCDTPIKAEFLRVSDISEVPIPL